MSNSEVSLPHGGSSFSADDFSFPEEGVSYEHKNGTIATASDMLDLVSQCPVFGEMAKSEPEMMGVYVELYLNGQKILNEKEKNDPPPDPVREQQPEKAKRAKSSEKVHQNKPTVKREVSVFDDNNFDNEILENEGEEDAAEKLEVQASPPVQDREVERYEAYFEREIAELPSVLETDDSMSGDTEVYVEQPQVNESGEPEMRDADVDAKESADLVVQSVWGRVSEAAVVSWDAPEIIEEKVADEAVEPVEPIVIARQEPEAVYMPTEDKTEVNFSRQEIAATAIDYKAEPMGDPIKLTEPKVDLPPKVQAAPYENFAVPPVEVSHDLLTDSAITEEVKTGPQTETSINQAESVLATNDSFNRTNDQNNIKLPLFSPDANKLPQPMFYQEGNQFESVTRTKIESKLLGIVETINAPVLLRDLNFQPSETGTVQPEKIIAFVDVKHEVEGKSFENTVVEAVKFLTLEEDSPEQERLHEIVRQIRLSMSSAEEGSETGEKERSMTPEAYENTLALLRFLGHKEPEEMLIQFRQAHGEDFLLDTLDYITSLNELDENEEQYANPSTVSTYNRLIELTSDEHTLEPDLDLESGQNETPLEGLVLIQLLQDAEVALDKKQDHPEDEGLIITDSLLELTADTQVSLLLNEHQMDESLDESVNNFELVNDETSLAVTPEVQEITLQTETLQLKCDEEVAIVIEKADEFETLNFNPENVMPLPMSLESIQENAEEQPLEQTLAQVALHLPEITQIPLKEFEEVVADIRELLADNHEKTDESSQAEDDLSDELREKTLKLVKLLGYSKPEEVVEKCVTEYGTDFLLKALSYICEPDDAFKRKTLELSIFAVGTNKRNKPSMEVSVGMTSKYIYLTAA